MKVSLPVLSDIEGIRRALSRGIRGLVALNHPHIVRVHEFDGLELADARSFYVVMDYVEGVVLDKWAVALPRNRDGVRGFIRIAFLIARALEAAHAARYLDDAGFETVGVMHGDVKPANILVRGDGVPVLMDFMMVDVQRALDLTIRERLATNGDALTQVFGTPGFMAPEQEREGIVTVRTDVYGLGATLRVAASGISLPPDMVFLLGRMTGPVTTRPQDMGEIARLLSDVARQEGLDSDEMRREQPPAKRGFLSAIASLIVRQPSILSPSNQVTSAAAEVRAAATYSEVPAIFCLRALTGPRAGAVHPLNSARVTVGRSAHNDVVLARVIAVAFRPQLVCGTADVCYRRFWRHRSGAHQRRAAGEQSTARARRRAHNRIDATRIRAHHGFARNVIVSIPTLPLKTASSVAPLGGIDKR